ncbi:MAG TPA: GNAT family protein [Micromonosporaceae bacterium]|jgi:RimJ/RimL family protein N-acetyltransferase
MAVRLRPIRQDDWEAVHSWARLPESCTYQAWGPNTPEQTYEFVQLLVAGDHGREPYAVEVDGTVRGLGVLTLSAQSQGEISYAVHPDVWGRGVGRSIGAELLRIGFEERGWHRIFGTCDPRNVGSARILQRLGMTYEGRMRECMLIRDGWRDSEIYSILEHEWPVTEPRCAPDDPGRAATESPRSARRAP